MLCVGLMLVYRDTRSSVFTRALLSELRERLASEPTSLAAVLVAGALECALADERHPAADVARELTDGAADAWLGGEPALRERARQLWAALSCLELPRTLALRKPEGFAFYALDPEGFRTLARAHAARTRRACAVLGVRSIGTTLSAVVRAELARSGVPAARITVRPSGHPWERRLSFTSADEAFFARTPADAEYLVVDEGPGMSGSTLLSVCDALAARGVPEERIHVFCSHAPDPAKLLAQDAPARWSRLSVHATQPAAPARGELDLSGGSWRALHYESEAAWPPTWVEHERVKRLTADGRALLKFAGYPPYDRRPFEQASALAEAGFSPPVTRAESGFLAYRWLSGSPLPGFPQDEGMLRHLAAYLTFRARAFPAQGADMPALKAMARLNVAESVAKELPPSFELELRTPVYADGQLMPSEWVQEGARLFKTDAVDHGDDDLFPGPTDLAWDVAGAVTEWNLSPTATEFFLRELERLSGDDVRPRLLHYVIAYLGFRLGVVSFAAQNEGERERVGIAGRYYEARLRRALLELR